MKPQGCTSSGGPALTVLSLLMGLRNEALSPVPIRDRTKGRWLLLRSSWASMKYSKLNRWAMMCTAGGKKGEEQTFHLPRH